MRHTIFAWALLLAVVPASAGIGTNANSGNNQSFARFLYVTNGYRPDTKFRAPSSVAVDQANNLVYVCDTDDKIISAFSLQGAGKFRIGEKGELDDPVSIAVDRQGNLYVSERRTRKIKIFDLHNTLASTIDLGTIESAAKVQPGRIAVSRDGELFVVDQANQQILVFDKTGKLKFKFGKTGDREGEFRTIEDVAVDRQDRIYVVDSSGAPVQVFNKEGKYISQIGIRGNVEGFVQPVALTIDRFDQLWIVDTAEHEIKIYDRVGIPLQTLGEYGMTERALFYPVDVGLDSLGRVYIPERGTRRMQVFELENPYQPLTRAR